MQANSDGEVLFQPPTERPKVGEWWLISVDGYNAGVARVLEEEYKAAVLSELEGYSAGFTLQDLLEESGPEENVGLNRFVRKLDPSQIGDEELSETFIAAKAKPREERNMDLTPNRKRRRESLEDHADDNPAKKADGGPSSVHAMAASPSPRKADPSSPWTPQQHDDGKGTPTSLAQSPLGSGTMMFDEAGWDGATFAPRPSG